MLRAGPASAVKQMLTVTRGDNGRALVKLNSSSLSILQTCPRKAFYLLNQNWRSRAVSPPLVFGQAIHAAMEVFYGVPRADREEVPPNFEDEAALLAHGHPVQSDSYYYRAVQAFVKVGEPLRMLPDMDTRSLASGIWTLGHYFRRYWNDEYVVFCDEQGPVVERTFSARFLEADTFDVDMFGTIDMVLQNLATSEVLPGDHKTSSRMGMEFLNRIKPNHQYTGYLWGAKHTLGLQTENFLVNGIQVKQAFGVKGNSLPPPNFTRQITRRTEQDFDEFRDVVEHWVRAYLQHCESGVWPLGTVDACSSWGGCSLLEVCSAPNVLRQNILEAKFERSL